MSSDKLDGLSMVQLFFRYPVVFIAARMALLSAEIEMLLTKYEREGDDY